VGVGRNGCQKDGRNGCYRMLEIIEDGIDMVARVWQEWLLDDVGNGCQSMVGMVARGC